MLRPIGEPPGMSLCLDYRRSPMAVARGEPGDLVLSEAVLSVSPGVARRGHRDKDGHVVGLGAYDGPERLDVMRPPCPRFIDAHMHIESSKLMVDDSRAPSCPRHDRGRRRPQIANARHRRHPLAA
jgi:hypothetical protein